MTNINRDPQEHWPHTEHAVELPIDAPSFELYKEMVDITQRVAAQNLANSILTPNPLFDMLSENYQPPPITLRRRLTIYRSRIRDAWQVLLGRAEIGDGW